MRRLKSFEQSRGVSSSSSSSSSPPRYHRHIHSPLVHAQETMANNAVQYMPLCGHLGFRSLHGLGRGVPTESQKRRLCGHTMPPKEKLVWSLLT
ncbi:hypothetical protein QJS04_geneDACA001611 [Acorus gramineus]|uniref:Uncharacterized protein n=1 Tax=Acorus gramineus TaxID=55184 RepID=A0AAV9BFU9_ACOGR|nr:hypothetical protein QJS04_geneDACA001611 [Acorus gramineus]